VPPDPPIKLFWSVTLYDVDTARADPERAEDRRPLLAHGPPQKQRRFGGHLLRSKSAGLASRRTGSRLCPGKNWFAYFRFYQPTEAYFDRSWPLRDFERL
jgi:hypothetical protein